MHRSTAIGAILLLPLAQCYLLGYTIFFRHSLSLSCSFVECQSRRITIPIFPLRKRVPVPTDSIQLRLWEPRYLELSEYIQNPGNNQDVFGAVYSSHKAQFVRRGTDPITPILEPGDIGVLCHVLRYHEEFNICKPSDYVDECARRIIQLDCKVSCRIRIDKIIERGIGESNNSLPFILVEASILCDTNEK